jgi:uncharacterized membrane-anchored protein YitT (DUF2179 family)
MMMMQKIKSMLLIHLGILMVAVGLYFFLMPNNLAVGGANGMAIVINYFIPTFSVGLLMLCINLILFIASFILIGNTFATKTIYVSMGISLLIMLLEKLYPLSSSLTGDLFLELIIGIFISAVGIGVVFIENASTGGTDIISRILHKYLQIDLGKGILLSDLTITLSAAFAFGFKLSMYATFGVIINGIIIDGIIQGINTRKEVTIVSQKYREINGFITNDLNRGSTLLSAEGGFTSEEKKIIIAVMGRRDFGKLKNFIQIADPNAFVYLKSTHEVFGEGFKWIFH